MTHSKQETTAPQAEAISARDQLYLTPAEVVRRYRFSFTLETLANHRAAGVGFPYLKVGKAVLYPVALLDDYDKKHLVICDKPNKESA